MAVEVYVLSVQSQRFFASRIFLVLENFWLLGHAFPVSEVANRGVGGGGCQLDTRLPPGGVRGRASKEAAGH